MENYCQGCTSSHQYLMNTWNKKGSLQPSNFKPFESTNLGHEGYCGNANFTTAWTRAGNVTPDNSSIYHTYSIKFTPAHKEKFNYDPHNTYSRLNQTWINQKAYTSN